MEWRCEWCGKPHEENDPPCDNCGSESFERAVVPVAPEGEGGPTVWVCTECGRAHPRNNPPCSRCGGMTLEQRERSYDAEPETPGEAVRSGDGTDGGAVADAMTVWACTECGRTHPRNNPPCSRCGNMTFERREQRFDDGPGATGWLDVLDVKVALGFVGAFVLLALVVGTTLGLVSVPGTGPPGVPDVPGEGTEVAGLSLSEVERSFVRELSDRRTAAGRAPVEWRDELADAASYNNRRVVKAADGDGTAPSEEELAERFGDVGDCGDRITYRDFVTGPDVAGQPVPEYESEDALAAALVDAYVEEHDGEFMRANGGFAAADVHVGPDGRVFVTVFVC